MISLLFWFLLAGPLPDDRQEPACDPSPSGRHDEDAARGPVVRVLFLGNSHTYVNRLPCLVQHLAASLEPGVALEVVTVARDGAALEHHWADSSTRALLEDQIWNIVVLQEQGRRPVEDPQGTARAVRRFADAGRRSDTEVVLYVPPPARGRAADLERVIPVFRQIAAATRSTIAPAAQAWAAAGRAHPDLDLHDPDGVHANATGSYLTACVLLAVITGRSPRGAAPVTLRRPYGSAPGATAIPDTLAQRRAAALQAVAWRAVQETRSAADGVSLPLRRDPPHQDSARATAR